VTGFSFQEQQRVNRGKKKTIKRIKEELGEIESLTEDIRKAPGVGISWECCPKDKWYGASIWLCFQFIDYVKSLYKQDPLYNKPAINISGIELFGLMKTLNTIYWQEIGELKNSIPYYSNKYQQKKKPRPLFGSYIKNKLDDESKELSLKADKVRGKTIEDPQHKLIEQACRNELLYMSWFEVKRGWQKSLTYVLRSIDIDPQGWSAGDRGLKALLGKKDLRLTGEEIRKLALSKSEDHEEAARQLYQAIARKHRDVVPFLRYQKGNPKKNLVSAVFLNEKRKTKRSNSRQ